VSARAELADGWIVASYDGRDMATVHMAVAGEWRPAFRDWHDGQRVAKVRPPAAHGRVNVRLSIDGQITDLGWIRL
jgi:hypothetical protein